MENIIKIIEMCYPVFLYGFLIYFIGMYSGFIPMMVMLYEEGGIVNFAKHIVYGIVYSYIMVLFPSAIPIFILLICAVNFCTE